MMNTLAGLLVIPNIYYFLLLEHCLFVCFYVSFLCVTIRLEHIIVFSVLYLIISIKILANLGVHYIQNNIILERNYK